MKKLIQKLFSGLGMAALVMIFGVVGGVFAATNWSTWTADMSVSNGDIMTAEKWNAMVAGVAETKTTADAALAAANNNTASPTIVAVGAAFPSTGKICWKTDRYSGTSYESTYIFYKNTSTGKWDMLYGGGGPIANYSNGLCPSISGNGNYASCICL